ncbi:MAG: inorganic phosphate transporter [Betaproteobacteria bacterium HGW-Betaproteobacteria-13]|uniref:Phosphate transporter n=1 Tax=Parazoarcus communis TaxID=41977 RepID=A0A2U8H0W5_9RHOO|nr:inorganic phosphate transporter [Parazoarcus communis]PKO81481.1 MAG: inorganic phosphate transporter [Betaproteobacteria bacterium HGW-Betaproteobacteria-13]
MLCPRYPPIIADCCLFAAECVPVDLVLVITVCAVATVLLFDYTNGFHDAANVVATVIASRAMSPAQAVSVVAVFEFLGPLLGGTAVANTIGGFVDLAGVPVMLSLGVLLAGLIGAIGWNLLTWWKGIPSSSSHALVGGLVGAVVSSAGVDHVVWGFSALAEGHLSGVTKVLLALVLSPLLGFFVGYLIHRFLSLLFRAARPTLNRHLRLSQYVTTAGLAFAHGANDAQKSMGILTLVLLLGGFIPSFDVPLWVMLVCAIAMTAGVLTGGWRIVRTLGFAVYKVRPLHALDSQLTSAAVILSASLVGAPVSTSHVVASSIMGIGASERPRSVRWGKAGEIVATWVITIPASAAAGAMVLLLLRPLLY